MKVHGEEFLAVSTTLQGLNTYRFFRKSGDDWLYDVPNSAKNPFSVIPYNDLTAIKAMVGSGKAKLNPDGKLTAVPAT